MPERYAQGYATLVTQHEQQHQQDEHKHSWCACPPDGHCPCGKTICVMCGAEKQDEAADG